MRKILRKIGSSDNVKLHLYDFDGTLFKSPEPPSWWSNKKMGYWFNEPISLSDPFIPVKPDASYWHGRVVRSAKESISDPTTLALMCTGRPNSNGAMRYRVAELLKYAGLDFDLVDLKQGTGSTAQYKAKLVFELLKKYPNIRSVSVWEDTKENLDAIENVCRKLSVEFHPHIVKGDPIPTDDVTIEQYQTVMKMAAMRKKAYMMRMASMNRISMARRIAARYMMADAKPTNVLFTEAVVDNPDGLIRWYEQLRSREKSLNLPDISHWKHIAHHMTFKFFGGKKADVLLPIAKHLGEAIVLKIVGVAYDDQLVALVVDPPDNLRGLVANKFPHITLALTGSAKPADSNKLIESKGYKPARGAVQARIGYRMGEIDVYTPPHDLPAS